jgi:hypothetical protein
MRRLVLFVLVGLTVAGCSNLLFYPMRQQVLTPDRIGLSYRDVWFHADDGVNLHGWFLPAKGEAKGTVVFLHGNAENISTHIANVGWLPAKGFNVFLFDYRGYGLSDGRPTLEGAHRDAEAAIDAVFGLDDVDGGRVVVFGQSLGGSIAIVALARSPRRAQVRALVVEGAFSGYRRIAREKLADIWITWPFQVPLSYAMDNHFKPTEAISRLSPMPVLIIHGLDDTIVPSEHAKTLFAAAREPKALWLLPETGHIGAFGSAANQDRLVGYLCGTAFKGSC